MKKRPWNTKKNRNRGKSKHYDDVYKLHKWKKRSKNYRDRKENKLCRYILTPKYPKRELIPAGNKLVPVECVDHVIPIEHGGAIWDERNWQPLTRLANDWKATQERHKPMYKWILNEKGSKIPELDNGLYILDEKH